MLTEMKMDFRMNTQDELFHEDWRDALRHLVKALGGYESAGSELFPAKTRKAAGNWLSDCLNAERPAKLDLEEIVALLKLGREIGCHTAMSFMADDIGYESPKPATPKSPKRLLLEKQAALAAEAVRLQKDIERIDAVDELKSVRAVN